MAPLLRWVHHHGAMTTGWHQFINSLLIQLFLSKTKPLLIGIQYHDFILQVIPAISGLSADSAMLGAASQAAGPCSGPESTCARLSLSAARLASALEVTDSTK